MLTCLFMASAALRLLFPAFSLYFFWRQSHSTIWITFIVSSNGRLNGWRSASSCLLLIPLDWDVRDYMIQSTTCLFKQQCGLNSSGSCGHGWHSGLRGIFSIDHSSAIVMRLFSLHHWGMKLAMELSRLSLFLFSHWEAFPWVPPQNWPLTGWSLLYRQHKLEVGICDFSYSIRMDTSWTHKLTLLNTIKSAWGSGSCQDTLAPKTQGTWASRQFFQINSECQTLIRPCLASCFMKSFW